MEHSGTPNPNNGTENPENGTRAQEPAKRKVGRPRTITLEVVEEIGTLVARGLTQEQACLSMEPEVNPKTLENALLRDPELRGAMKRQHAAFLRTATARVYDGVQGWQGAAWILERRHKPQFQRTEILQHQEHQDVVLTDNFAGRLAKVLRNSCNS